MKMIERPWVAAMLGFGLSLAGCEHRDTVAPGEHVPAAQPGSGAPAARPTTLDARRPVPMTAMMAEHQKQEMRDHLQVIQEIVAGLGKDDFAAIEKAATRIGWNDREVAMCRHMGAGAPGFAELGERFHRTADRIAAAARDKDHARVVTELDATLQACTQCHAAFRLQVTAVPPAMAGEAPAEMPMHDHDAMHGPMHDLDPMHGSAPATD